MKKLLIAAVGLVVVGGVAAFWLFQQASKDTEQITTLQEEKLSKEELDKMATQKAAGFDEARKAAEQAGELAVDKQLELWKTQLTHESMSVRMQAARELVELEAASGGAATKLLEEVSTDEKQDRDLRTFIQREWALKKLAAMEEGARLPAAREMLKDGRSGFRMVALENLASDKDAQTIELIKKVADADADEDVQDMAKEILGLHEDEDEDDDDEEE